MRTRKVKLASILGALALTACTSATENVLFVTSTAIDIGFDAAVGDLNVGYGRDELIIGPQYVETGATPPVVASLSTNLKIWEPDITQFYATGDAARIATGTNPASSPTKVNKLKGEKRPMFFGTSSNLGVKVTFANKSPSVVSFGYRRRELSVIPIGLESGQAPTVPGSDGDKYGSVLAFIDLESDLKTQEGGVHLSQFFATGEAANNLASASDVAKSFEDIANQSAKSIAGKAGEAAGKRQVSDIDRIKECVTNASGKLDSAALGKLVTASGVTGAPAVTINQSKTLKALQDALAVEMPAIKKLAAAAKTKGNCVSQ